MSDQPLVIAYHLIWTAYGWWLPNDPRGSGAKAIRNDIIADLGQLHYGRKQVQPAGREIRQFYERAASILHHPLLAFDGSARPEIGAAVAEVIAAQRYTCYACAIMPDHVHLLIRKHRDIAEDMIAKLKESSRLRLSASGLRSTNHATWAGGGGWKVIERNPLELGLSPQKWPFVKEYDGWLLHPGHSPNSPHAQRLRVAGRYPKG